MSETLRTFIAVELTEEIRAVLEDIQGRLKPFHADVKWVEPHHIHLTLKFVGDVRPKDIPLLTETLKAALHEITPIPTELMELGAFPDLRHPRVLWAGLKDNDGRIAQLASTIEAALGKIGYKKESRDFKAHVTLGRVRSLKNTAPLVKGLQEYRFSKTFPQVIAGITLFKSTLTPSGPVYEILEKFNFPVCHDKKIAFGDNSKRCSQRLGKCFILSYATKNLPQKEKTTPTELPPILHVALILFWALLLLQWLALNQGVSLQETAVEFLNGFYIPHHNFCIPGGIAGININMYLYFLIFVATTTLLLIRRMFFRSHNNVSILHETQRVLLTVFVIVLILQTMNQMRYFFGTFDTYNGKDIEVRYRGPIKGVYDFAQFCKIRLPGQHNAELITDLDTSQDPGMFLHRTLAYHLYPIDIRDIREGDKKILIAFEKKDAAHNIPRGYQLLGAWDNDNIVAIRLKKIP